MALTQKLLIRQSQALVMTPQLMQAIKLLQLPNLDLAAYVEGELERNPLLERGAENEPAGSEAGGKIGDSAAAADDTRDDALDGGARDEAGLDDAAPARSRLSDMQAGYSQWAG